MFSYAFHVKIGVWMSSLLVAALAAAAPAVASVGQLPDAEQRYQPPERLGVLERYFPDRFSAYVSEHFILLHETRPAYARLRAALLELTHQRFHEAFDRPAFDIEPLEQRLVGLLFTGRQRFHDYAQEVDNTDMSWSGGYYSSRTNRIALFEQKRERDAWRIEEPSTDDSQPHTAMLSASLDPAAFDGPAPGLASTTHEAAHQLAFNTGLQRRGQPYPFWVSEGIATAFEAHDPREPFGPAYVNTRRLNDLLAAREGERWLDLDELIALDRPDTRDRPAISAAYAQAWSLFHYLYNHHPRALGRYLEQLAQPRYGAASEAERRREFEEAFGPVEEAEQRWLESIERMTHP